jgi:hypothetical protein
VNPDSVTQFSPDVLQRSHWNVNWIGCVPVQVPVVERSVSSTWGVPLIVGGAVLRGATVVRADPPAGSSRAVARAAAAASTAVSEATGRARACLIGAILSLTPLALRFPFRSRLPGALTTENRC